MCLPHQDVRYHQILITFPRDAYSSFIAIIKWDSVRLTRKDQVRYNCNRVQSTILLWVTHITAGNNIYRQRSSRIGITCNNLTVEGAPTTSLGVDDSTSPAPRTLHCHSLPLPSRTVATRRSGFAARITSTMWAARCVTWRPSALCCIWGPKRCRLNDVQDPAAVGRNARSRGARRSYVGDGELVARTIDGVGLQVVVVDMFETTRYCF